MNPVKCEILAFNCDENQVKRLTDATGMKRVNTLKHLGLKINHQGKVTAAENIEPILETMQRIASSFDTDMSTPLGRALYAKYLLSSRYIHKIQNYVFKEKELDEFWKIVRAMTWTRARPQIDSTTTRVHISKERVSQPLQYGGLAVPNPKNQVKSLAFTWARKFEENDDRLIWIQLVNHMLQKVGSPDANTHMKLGALEWEITADRLTAESEYWQHVFQSISEIIILQNKHNPSWPNIPFLGYEGLGKEQTIASLHYKNPAARQMLNNGCRNVGQLFKLNEAGQILPDQKKTFDELENEFRTAIPMFMRNTINSLVAKVKAENRTQMNSQQFMLDNLTTLQNLVKATKTGCSSVTKLLLKEERSKWSWGTIPRSYHTYRQDQITNIEPEQFMRALRDIRKNGLMPNAQWTSIQILLRTVFTKMKTKQWIFPPDYGCSNCANEPETTKHLFYECQLAESIWDKFFHFTNEIITDQELCQNRTNKTMDAILFHFLPDTPKQIRSEVTEVIMLIKHAFFKLKYRTDYNRLPSPRKTSMIIILDLKKLIT